VPENTSQLTRAERSLVITKDNRIPLVLEQFGDVGGAMEIYGIKRVGLYSLQLFLAKPLTVEWQRNSTACH
jgi:hypothetical protein